MRVSVLVLIGVPRFRGADCFAIVQISGFNKHLPWRIEGTVRLEKDKAEFVCRCRDISKGN